MESKQISHSKMIAERDDRNLLEFSAAEEVPTREKPKSSFSGAVFNLCNTIIGSGTLCLPFAASSSGYLMCNIIMVIVFVLTMYSVHLLVSASDLAGKKVPKNYEGLGFYSIGRVGAWISELTFIFGGFGVIVSYLVFCTHLSTLVFPIPSSNEWIVTLFISIVIVLPLSLVRAIRKLRFVSLLAVLSVVYLVFFVVFAAVSIPAQQLPHRGSIKPFDLSTGSIFSVTLLINAFCCHNTVLPVYEELENATPRRMNLAVLASLVISFLVYEIVALSGYYMFGSGTKDDILLNFDEDFLKQHPAYRLPFQLACASMIICLLFSAPVAMWPFRSCLLSVCLRIKHARFMSSNDATRTEFLSVTCVAVASLAFCAIVTPNVRTPLSLVGSVAGSLIIFILPSLFYIKLAQKSWRQCLGAWAMLGFGLALGPFCLSLTIRKLVNS